MSEMSGTDARWREWGWLPLIRLSLTYWEGVSLLSLINNERELQPICGVGYVSLQTTCFKLFSSKNVLSALLVINSSSFFYKN